MSARAPVAKLLLAGGAVVAGVLAVELCLRLFHPVRYLDPAQQRAPQGEEWTGLVHKRSTLPGLDYELAPDLDREARGIRVKTNALGMRDDPPLPATETSVRIAVLGDSIAFGMQLEEEHVFATILERSLNAGADAGRRFEVLNFGVSGYSTRNEVALFEHRVLALEPDAAVVAYCLNDPDNTATQPLQRHFMPVEWWQHSHLARWIAQKAAHRRFQRQGGGGFYRFHHVVEGASWRSVVAAFARLRELTSPRGIPVLVAIFPALEQADWAQYPFADLHAQVRAEAEQNGFAVLDLRNAYSAHLPADLTASDGFHPNELGHRIAAEEIEQALKPLLDRRGPK